MLRKFCVLMAALLLSTALLRAQVKEAATAGGLSLEVGGQVSTFNPDWGCVSASPFSCWNHQLFGLGVVVDANHLVYKFGAEGEARWLHWRGPGQQLVQTNYLIGPRYPVLRHGKTSLYAKALFGGSWSTFDQGLVTGSYFTIAPGATVEYHLTRRLIARGDYEYQMWPAFSGVPTLPNNGLTPNGFSAGVSYQLLR